jgi:hypothetical protein
MIVTGCVGHEWIGTAVERVAKRRSCGRFVDERRVARVRVDVCTAPDAACRHDEKAGTDRQGICNIYLDAMRGRSSLWVLAAGCHAFDATGIPDAAPSQGSDAPPTGNTYHATAVRFETAGNDYIWTGTLQSQPPSPRGTYSAWFHFNPAGDNKKQLLSVASVALDGGVYHTQDGHIRFELPDCLGVVQLDMQTAGTYGSKSGWIHVLAAWDLDNKRADLYVDGALDRTPNATIGSGSVCYAADRWGIGGLTSGQLDADVADLYANLGTYLDITTDSIRARFRDANKPVDLGTDCTAPTGAQPSGCFIGAQGTWNINKGNAGGFTLAGNGLALAPTSPSD